MTTLSASPARTAEGTPTVDFAAVKTRQQATWASGDYAVVGSTLQIVGETLCEALDLRADERVLDVAAGNGNATLAAARRFCRVVSTDYVGSLLERGSARAAADGFSTIEFREADAEALPFADGEFDAAMSTFGVMFTPEPPRAAAELLRVVRAGGRIGMANWTPDGFIGQLFKTIGAFVPPPAGIQSPALWGSTARIDALFGAHAEAVRATPRQYVFRYRSPQHWIDVFRTWYGPVLKAFAALDDAGKHSLDQALHGLIGRFNRADDGTMVVPSEYLEVVVVKR